MVIEIVDLPIENGDVRYVNVYQRGTHLGMVNIPPIKMVMAGGWLMALLLPHFR